MRGEDGERRTGGKEGKRRRKGSNKIRKGEKKSGGKEE